MRDVADVLERLRLPWYLTGSEALAAYASPRQTLDTDLVIDAFVDRLAEVAGELASGYYFAPALRIGTRWMASLIDRMGGAKVDLIIRDPDRWGREAMSRRRAWDHPVWGALWVSSLEDLILAKLEWSEGVSELQLRDCGMLLRMNDAELDRGYLRRWAREIGVEDLLRQAWDGHEGAP